MKRLITSAWIALWALVPINHVFALTLVEGGKPKVGVVVDVGAVTPEQQKIQDVTTRWLLESIEQASGAKLAIGNEGSKLPTLLLTTAAAQPELAKRLKLRTEHHDAYAIETTPDRLTLLGSNVYALRHAAAHVLRDLGFRYYAPSPRWHIIPQLPEVRVDLNLTSVPDLGARKIWYAYGQPDKELAGNYDRWVMGNRLTGPALLQTGHSYGNIILRNAAEFAKHPEYYAQQESGGRDTKRVPAASKFCVSNPGLMDLVARDRIRLLGEMRKANPLAYMVSVDPSDGQGTCHCDQCKALGTNTDRVIHLANHVARKVREVYPDGWVGLYAYSSHRLPPTITVEPNVYVQVALAFNQTEFSLPELVERWSKKTSAIGLREYYGVEAWDWGLPGQMRGGKPAYHKEWIPFYAARKVNAINAETNANWGGQMLGLFIASELMWDLKANVPALEERYFTDCFGTAAPAMRELQKKFDAGGPLQALTLRPMFLEVEKAWGASDDPKVRARLADMMAYLLYADAYRKFVSTGGSRTNRDDAYYQALKPLMSYAWQIRSRDIVHYYALARRLCNGLPLQDKRPEFYMNRKDAAPVWMVGAALSDDDIVGRFRERVAELQKDTDPQAYFSRSFQNVRPAGADQGASRLAADPKELGVAEFRGKLTGYLIGAEGQKITLDLKPVKRATTFTLFKGEEALVQQSAKDEKTFTPVEITLPKSGEYRFTLEGGAILRVALGTPLIYEASATAQAWVDYSGPHYFYVPRGVKQIFVAANPRLALHVPGLAKRLDVTPEQNLPGKDYAAIDVPEGADGKVWHTDVNTRGKFLFLNIPPLLSLSREVIIVPREVAETDGLTTAPAVPPK